MQRIFRLAAIAAGLIALATAPASAQQGLTTGVDGIRLQSPDGNFELTLGGRLHLDAVTYHDQTRPDASLIRVNRARVELTGKVAKIITFRADRELARSGGWRQLWLGVEPIKNFTIRSGNLIVPFSMEELQSSNKSALMERSLVSALAPSYSLGAMGSYGSKNFTISGGYFGKALGTEDARSVRRGNGYAARVTFAPMLKRHSFAHLALSAEDRTLNSSDLLRFSARAGSPFAPTLLKTRELNGADSFRLLGGEAAYAKGPFMIVGQYARAKVHRSAGPSLHFEAWYAQASVVLFGGDYGYSRQTGTVSGVDLREKRHVLELAARLSGIDLNDQNVRAGIGKMITLGVNYYLNQNVRFMVNASSATAHDRGLLGDHRRADVIAGRLQVSF